MAPTDDAPTRPVLAVIPSSERDDELSQALRRAGEAAGLSWHPTDPSTAAGVLANLCAAQGEGRVGVLGVGSAGEPALVAAAGDGRVGALALVNASMSAEAIALVDDWPELPVTAVADPRARAGLRAAVDVHLASAHQASDLRIGPIDDSVMRSVMDWFRVRLTQAARIDEVSFPSEDGWELHGTRWLPDRDHPVPGVVLLHTGRSDRAVFARLERLLAEAGLAVLNFDWRGRGQSTNRGSYFDLDAEERAAAWRDALAAISHLAEQPGVDGTRLGAVGVVHGAEYAVRAAVRDARVRALVLLTGYRPADDSEADHLTSSAVDVLHITSTDHTITTDAMRALYEASTGRRTRYVEYPGGAIGYQLFEIDHQLEPRIVDWLKEVLGS